MSKLKTSKYVVTSKFAHFKVGQVIELDDSVPSAAQAHVKRHIEPEDDNDNSASDSEALTALGELYTLHTGDKAGKKGVKTLKEAIIKSMDTYKEHSDGQRETINGLEDQVAELSKADSVPVKDTKSE